MNEFYGKKDNYGMWYEMFKRCLLGMNIGINGNIEETGELNVIESLKASGFIGGGCLFDVGANKGDYTLALSDAFPDAIVHSFEPSHYTFNLLFQNIGGRRGVVINNFGLGEHKENLELYSDCEGSGLASIYKRDLDYLGISMDKSEMVCIDTLDHYCEENNIHTIDFLKLDVEGNELNVLRGAKKMLESGCIYRIQMEFGGCNIDSRTFFRDFWNMLHCRYRVYRVLKDGLWEIKRYTERLELFSMTTYYFELKEIESLIRR